MYRGKIKEFHVKIVLLKLPTKILAFYTQNYQREAVLLFALLLFSGQSKAGIILGAKMKIYKVLQPCALFDWPFCLYNHVVNYNAEINAKSLSRHVRSSSFIRKAATHHGKVEKWQTVLSERTFPRRIYSTVEQTGLNCFTLFTTSIILFIQKEIPISDLENISFVLS